MCKSQYKNVGKVENKYSENEIENKLLSLLASKTSKEQTIISIIK